MGDSFREPRVVPASIQEFEGTLQRGFSGVRHTTRVVIPAKAGIHLRPPKANGFPPRFRGD